MGGAITVAPMAAHHVEQVAAIHARELSEDFLPSLGRAFLARSYYPAMLRNPYACVLVAIDGGTQRVAGFVNVAVDPGRYLSWFMRRNMVTLSLALLRLLLIDPKRVLEAIAISRTRVTMPANAGEVAFIAVDRDHQKQGVGAMMVEATNRHLLQRRVTRCLTKTLAHNEHVIDFYVKRWGARVFATTRIVGKTYRYLVWDLRTNATHDIVPKA
jgi:ribosomal protein S18 acetylase RimI-like enzyme